jgi:hypothetical protein
MNRSAILLAGVAFLFAGCGADKPPPPNAAAAQSADPVPNSNVFSTDLRALQKAKDVQNVVNDQQKATDKKLNDEGG